MKDTLIIRMLIEILRCAQSDNAFRTGALIKEAEAAISTRPNLFDMESPIPIQGEAVDCVELTIYDDDGPEGLYMRWRFSRSSEAIAAIMQSFSMEELPGLNFKLHNYWSKGA